MANIHSLNIGGSTYVIEPKIVKINDVRGADRPTSYFADCALTPWFNQNAGFNGNHWSSGITMKGWNNHYQSWQLAAGSSPELQSDLKFRIGDNDVWEDWRKVILEGDAATSASSIYVTYNPSSNNNYSVPFMDYGHTQNSKIYSDDTFNYNPYTNTLTSRNFAGTATQAGQIAIHTKEFIKDSGLCLLEGMYEVPVILGGCDCTIFSDQSSSDYFGLMTDYHPQNNNSSWLRYNFNDQTLKSTNFKGNLIGTATNSTYINVASSSTNNGTYMLTFVNGTGNRKAYTNSGVCVNPYSKTIFADQIRGFGTGSWNQDYEKAITYNGSISSGSSWSPVCAVRTKGGVWSMGHIWPGDSQNYLTFSYVGDSVRAVNGNITVKLPVPKYNRMNFIPIGDQQFDGKPAVARIVTLSSSQYNNLTSKDPNTLYLII